MRAIPVDQLAAEKVGNPLKRTGYNIDVPH